MREQSLVETAKGDPYTRHKYSNFIKSLPQRGIGTFCLSSGKAKKSVKSCKSCLIKETQETAEPFQVSPVEPGD
jgi:hypothetical protein